MKKRIVLTMLALAMLVCLFAISVSAAEPDASGESVTLADGTVCPIWDTEGNGLIWYIASTDDAGVKTYAYVSANSSAVDYMGSWTGTVHGKTVYEVNKITITVGGVSYGADKMAVVNMKKDVVLTSNKCVGEKINCFSKSFTGSKTLEYMYAPVDTISFQAETFKSCSNLKYVNLEELTELRKIGSQDFNGCSSLCDGEVLDLSNTQLIEIGGNGLSHMNFTSVIFPKTIQTIGNCIFQSCKKLVSVHFPESVTSFTNFNYTFDACSNLETITGLDSYMAKGKLTYFGVYAFNGCKKLKNIDGIMTDGIMILPEGFTSASTLCFSECDQIKFVEFPSTINYVGQACFSWCDNLTLVSFDKVDAKIRSAIANGESYTKVSFNNCGTFKGCPKLAALSVPEGTTEIINRFVAQGCTSLTAFYMPNSVVSLGTNGGQQGPFCSATSMYFVSEPFTVSQCLVNGEIDLSKLNLPAKPTVYFMPTNLTTTHGHVFTNQHSKDGTLFLDCRALNDVIVFGEKYVDFNARNAFQGMGTADSPKTVVFLGDMTQFVTFKNAQYISFVFANANDKSPEDLGIVNIEPDQNNTDSYMYFCADGSRYDFRIAKANIASDVSVNIATIMATKTNDAKHVSDPTSAEISREATCIANAFGLNICFCGAEIGESEIEGTMLGHSHTIDLGVVYLNYMDNSYYSYECSRCGDIKQSNVAFGALFVDYGYSATEVPINGTYSMSQFYGINKLAIEQYRAINSNFEFGFVVAANVDPIGAVENGTLTQDKVFIAEERLFAYNYVSVSVSGIFGENMNKTIAFCMYVKDGGNTYYIDGGKTVETVAMKSYNDIISQKN